GQLRLVGPVRQVWVFNLQGGLVAQPVLTPGQLEHSLDLGHLPAGLYLLRYLGPNGQPGTEKVLIAR
nr:T9SS type A sorting domain-containing protein [Bernardetiaceae bacterium]